MAVMQASLFKGMPEHFGVKGKRYELELRLVYRFERGIDAFKRYRYRFQDAAGHCFTWDTDALKPELVQGWEGRASFTVAGFSRTADRQTRIANLRFK